MILPRTSDVEKFSFTTRIQVALTQSSGQRLQILAEIDEDIFGTFCERLSAYHVQWILLL